MKPSTQQRKELQKAKTIFIGAAALALTLAAGKSIGNELCARTDGSSVRHKATGSVLMAGSTVVGMTIGMDGTKFSTDPTLCGSHSNVPFPDCDDDNLITLADFHCLSECLTGPDVAMTLEKCIPFDMDHNNAVDVKDVQLFQNLIGTSSD